MGNLVTELEGHLDSISSGNWLGAWLPKKAVCALACLVTACALRPGVEVKKALALLQRGLTFAQEGLDAEGLDNEVCFSLKSYTAVLDTSDRLSSSLRMMPYPDCCMLVIYLHLILTGPP